MEFGTIKSIIKKPDPAQSVDGDDFSQDPSELEFPTDGVELTGDEPSFDEPSFDEPADKMTELLQRLTLVRDEIDKIFSDMGYDEFESMSDDDDEFQDSDFDFDSGEGDGEEGFDFDAENATDTETGDEFSDDNEFGDEFGGEFGDDDAGEFAPDEMEGDPDFQGNIRTVAGANLVFKRKGEDGNYEELWVYNIGEDMKKESQIRRAILAGTDIVPNRRESEDGIQQEETWSAGNVQYLKLTGLPN